MARKREQITPNPGDTRYIRRDDQGRFTDNQVDRSRSLSVEAHQKTKAKTTVPKGQGDKGDQKKD